MAATIFTVYNKALLPIVKAVAGVVDNKSSLPVLSHLLLEVEGSILTVTGIRELEQVRSACPCLTSSGNVKLTIPASLLSSFLTNLKADAEVTFETGKDTVTLSAGMSTMKFKTLDPKTFPVMEVNDLPVQAVLKVKALKRALGEASFAMAKADVRVYLNGCLFSLEGDMLTVVATDTFRLVKTEAKLDAPITSDKPQTGIVPRTSIMQLLRMLPDTEEAVVIGLNDEKAVISWGQTEHITSLTTGRYPDWQRVVPNEEKNPFAVTMSRAALSAAVRHAALLSDENHQGVQVDFKDNLLKVTGFSDMGERSVVQVPCDWDYEAVTSGFNKKYLLDVFGALKADNLTLSLNNKGGALLLTKAGDADDGFKAVVMPCRV